MLDVPGVRSPDAIVDIGAYEVGIAKIFDARLDGVMPNGQDWLRSPYSFAELVPVGMQLTDLHAGRDDDSDSF